MNREPRTPRPPALALFLLALATLLLVACPATPVNHAPEAHDQAITVVEDTPTDLTLDITDADGDDLTCTITNDPAHGTLTGTPPDLTYTPDDDYAGTDAFTYTTCDGDLTSAEATVTLTITNTNDAPLADDQTLTTPEDTPLTITLTATDADGDALTYTVTSDPTHGTLSDTLPDVTYTPDADYVGGDAFTFTASDGTLTSNEATITIDIGSANDPPTSVALEGAIVPENADPPTDVGTLTTSDPDPGNDHTYTLVPGPGDTDNGDFTITGATLQTTTAFDHETTPTKTVRIRTTDPHDAYLEQAFTITVTNVNEFPTRITLTPNSIPENEPAGTLLGTLTNDDPDQGDTHTYTLTNGTGDDDNHRFTLTGDELHTTETLDHETTPALTIRVLCQDQGGLGVEQAIAITVEDVEEPAVTSVTIDQVDVHLDVGETTQLTATVVTSGGADATVLWSSGDDAVATVSETGTVTGVAAGTTTVTATSAFDPTRYDSVPVEVHEPPAFPITGPPSPGMECYDRIVGDLMQRYEIPGGAVAVVKDGQLVFAHGYGWADVEHAIPVQPDMLFRVASLDKMIVSAAILTLWEEGRLELDDPAFAYLPDLEPPESATVDERLSDVSIRDLLHHSGGWDRSQSFDPMFLSTYIANVMGVSPPADGETIIRYMLGQPLQFDPGTRYAYANFGYNVLHRIVESVTGSPYMPWTHDHVLAPAGATGIVEGLTRFEDRAPNEVLYYAVPGEPLDSRLVRSVFPDDGLVPEPYGGFFLYDGVVSSPIDFLRFVRAVDGRTDAPDILAPATIEVMTARPPDENVTWHGTPSWYAMGWSVQVAPYDSTWWHNGSLPGTRTVVVRAHDGISWAAFFNTRTSSGSFGAELDTALGAARSQVTTWPDVDLFPSFP